MEIILSSQCERLTGSLDTSLGYFIQKRGERFFSQRSKHSVPRDGHWRFICQCAELAQAGLYVSDVRLKSGELGRALNEARIGYIHMFRIPIKKEYNAADGVLLKERLKV